MAHWNGSAWSSVDSGVTNLLYGIWGRASNDVWAVGYSGTILHYDGTNWSEVDAGTTDTLRDVWAAAPDDVWAVGYEWDTNLGYVGGTILHWDGSTWTKESTEAKALFSITGTGPDDVWVAGVYEPFPDHPHSLGPYGYNMIYHWDGSSWTEVPGNGYAEAIHDVWVTTDQIQAVGAFGTILCYDR
jgi:hypothetical protein